MDSGSETSGSSLLLNSSNSNDNQVSKSKTSSSPAAVLIHQTSKPHPKRTLSSNTSERSFSTSSPSRSPPKKCARSTSPHATNPTFARRINLKQRKRKTQSPEQIRVPASQPKETSTNPENSIRSNDQKHFDPSLQGKFIIINRRINLERDTSVPPLPKESSEDTSSQMHASSYPGNSPGNPSEPIISPCVVENKPRQDIPPLSASDRSVPPVGDDPSISSLSEASARPRGRKSPDSYSGNFWPPSRDPDPAQGRKGLLRAIESAMHWVPNKPFELGNFKTSLSTEAAQTNAEILKEFNYDLDAMLRSASFENSIFKLGSEFRPILLLDDIFRGHPLWPRVRKMLTDGFTMPLADLPEQVRQAEIREMLNYGNHKSAMKDSKELRPILIEEVAKGWQLVIPIQAITQIPHASVSPLGLAFQQSIDESGNLIPKWRVTHDQSFEFHEGAAVNSRVDQSALTKCMYGFALKRFIHAILFYRLRFPSTELLLSKVDLKAAYRRIHFSGISAVQSITTTKGLGMGNAVAEQGNKQSDPGDLALISLRMTFGGSANPSEFSALSESITDLANTLIQIPEWDPLTLHSPFVDITDDSPRTLSSDTPFRTAKPLLVDLSLSEFGASKVYIDDIFTIFPHLSENHWHRGRNAVLLAIDAVGRPTHPEDPLPRDPLIAIKKLEAEGTPSEILTILGWEIDTRSLLIRLPKSKAILWETELQQVISSRKAVSAKTMERIQGRNSHIAVVVPGALHFQNRTYKALMRAKKYGATQLKKAERDDLSLALQFLRQAAAGIDLNMLSCREPDHLGRSDALQGIGGFDLTSGMAWRWQVPPELQEHRKSQNYLEFLACLVQILFHMITLPWKAGDCFLSIGDSTNALCWIQKSNFDSDSPDQASHTALAQEFVFIMSSFSIVHYGQWFPGRDNTVADALSRRFDLSDSELTEFISSNHSSQMPDGFQLRALPPELSSWTDYWVRHGPGTMESPPPLTLRPTLGGNGGSISSRSATSKMIASSSNSPRSNDSISLEHSSKKCEMESGPSLRRATISWLRKHAVPPSMLYARPSSLQDGTILARTGTEHLLSFYSDK